MRGSWIAVGAACLLLVSAAMAQAPQASQSTPSAAVQRLGYFAGDWKVSGTTHIGPNTPAAPFTTTEQGEWLPGGYFLEVKMVTHGPLGDVHTVRMMEYNPADKAYTFNEYNSLGEHVLAIGHIDGDTWGWDTEKKLNGVVAKGRYIVTFVSPDSYTFKSQTAKPNGGWVTVSEGKATRAQ